MGKQDKPADKEAPVGKNHQLKVVSYDRETKTALVELSPAYVDASRPNETRRYTLMSHVPKGTLAYLIGAKKGERMDVTGGAVHAYRPDRMAEYVRALDRHRAEKEVASRPAVVERDPEAAIAKLEALAEDSDDSAAGEEIDIDPEELKRELGGTGDKK